MRSISVAFRPLLAAVGLGLASTSALALAEEVLPAPPMVEEQQAAAPPQSTTTTTTVTTTTTQPAAPAQPPTAAQPAAPPVPPVPPVPGGTTSPMYFNGPVWVVPAPVTGVPVPQPQVAQPPASLPPPVYVQPSHRVRTAQCCVSARDLRLTQRPPIFSVGLRFTAMGTNQEVFGHNLNLLGGGLQLRFRNRGHWGFETAFDVMRANIGDGAFVRMAYPWTAGVMLYLFKNRLENHFNLYGIAGVGLVADDVTLYQGSRQERRQQFLEVMGQAGGGVELRFRHLALMADLRAVGLLLDTTGPAGTFYRDIEGGPIPAASVGYKANLGALVWF
ncbi:MAG: hypothetical protein RMK29_15345 [Myxococcales bacterium]|nr:hypothetical protein [Myxococcota bacterium]MDW8283091.1 hypothetical protein [Myxococcales bacterium]